MSAPRTRASLLSTLPVLGAVLGTLGAWADCRGADNSGLTATSPLEFILSANDGKPYALAQHRGQVVMIVNTASKCGFTKQYAGLEKIYKKYQAQGFVIIGVPANNFGGQEPGSDADIATFCTKNFGVTFPLMAKAEVAGSGKIPLYSYLTEKSPKSGGIKWNFTKFLIGRDGQVVERFGSMTDPESSEVTAAIEKLLAAPAPVAAPAKP